MLPQSARTLQRPGDLAARFGGEELAFLLPNTDARGAKNIAERVRAAVAALALPHAGISPRQVITISVSIATMRSSAGWAGTNPMRGFSPWRLDSALYGAKRLGRNRVHAAPPLVSIASMWDNIPAQSA